MAASALPSTGAPEPADGAGCDVSDMYMVHGLLRMHFGDAPGLVGAVPTGSTERAGVISDHLEELALTLHDHHQTEDDVLWGQLEAKDVGCVVHTTRMKAAHVEIGERLDALKATLPAWRETGGAAERDRVHTAAGDVLASLTTHLGDEEGVILPIASRTLTQAEWNRLGEVAQTKIPRNRLFIHLGFILESMPPDEADRFLKKELPGPVRLLWKVVGRRRYVEYRDLVYGTAA